MENRASAIGVQEIKLASGTERSNAHKFYEKIGYQKAKTQVKFHKTIEGAKK